MRLFWFLVTIAIGSLIGIYFGWVSTPLKIEDTSLSDLRSDYHTDYILMVAESYETTSNLTLATYQLAYLGGEEPLRYVQQAIISAEALGFSARDIETLAVLASGYQSPAAATVTP